MDRILGRDQLEELARRHKTTVKSVEYLSLQLSAWMFDQNPQNATDDEFAETIARQRQGGHYHTAGVIFFAQAVRATKRNLFDATDLFVALIEPANQKGGVAVHP